MSRSNWIHTGTVLKMNAINYPDQLGWQDTSKEFTFREWDGRSNRLANGLLELGVGYKDTFAVISYNRGEWMDIYAAAAKGGQVVVPIMFSPCGSRDRIHCQSLGMQGVYCRRALCALDR